MSLPRRPCHRLSQLCWTLSCCPLQSVQACATEASALHPGPSAHAHLRQQPDMIDHGSLAADGPFNLDDGGMKAMDGGARRGEGFKPQYVDPSDDADTSVPDDVWASDDFQDKLWNFTQESAGPSIRATEARERNFQFVRPKPAFVFKTIDRAGGKVFINVCSSPQVPKPPEITPQMLQGESARIRIPLSMGEPREDQDKEGKPCTTYDAIMHTDPVERAKTEKSMKDFVVELCLQWVEQKFSLELSRTVKFPKGMQAKGEPDIQTIRRNTNQIVEEVGANAYQTETPQPVEQPEFAVSVTDGKVIVSVALPRLESTAGVELEHSSRRLFLKVPGMYTLTVTLPVVVGQEGADSQFNKADRVLTVWLMASEVEEVQEPTAPTARLPRNALVTELD